MYFSLEWIVLSNRGCVTSKRNVWKSRQETSKFVRVIRMFFTVSVLICVFSLVQTSFISEKTLVGSISSWQTQTELDHLEDISTRYILLVEVRKQLDPSFVNRHVLTLPPCTCACFCSDKLHHVRNFVQQFVVINFCGCNDQGELCVWSKLTRQHEFNSEQRSSLLNRDKSGTDGHLSYQWCGVLH